MKPYVLAIILILSGIAWGQAYREVKVEADTAVKKEYSELFKGGWILVFSDTKFCWPCRAYSPVVSSVEKTHRVRKIRPREHPMLSE
jgi:hypothetical protein